MLLDSASSRHLVLHFDINETILIGDEAGGDTAEDCLNKILAKSAFVKIPSETPCDYASTSSIKPTHWWDGSEISDSYPDSTEPPPFQTEWEWPAGCCPYYRTSFKSISKTFVEHHGSIYEDTHHHLEKLLHINRQNVATVSETVPALSDCLPALFETLQALSKSKMPHTVVLRTFGSDLGRVADAVNAFASGKHPCYPSFRDDMYVIPDEHLVKGRWTTDRTRRDGPIFQLFRDKEMVASGDKEVLDFIHSKRICGIQDDYLFWRKHHYEPWAGKPVWIPSNEYYHHLLFDDNIHNLENDSVASVRKQLDQGGPFVTLDNRDILRQHGLHMIRVPTIEPLRNPSWFLEMLAKVQKRLQNP